MKENIAKNTLSFSCSKKMKFLRTPPNIWKMLNEKYNFTLDACASKDNHLVKKFYTKENSCLDKDWTNEVVYLHPLFDTKIGNFVKKAYEEKCKTVMLLPASTHTRYFHKYLYKKKNVKIEFLEKPKNGFRFGNDDGSVDDGKGIGYIKSLMIIEMDNTNIN
jgi:phage N-6-adenine-methyltransferase